MQMAVGIGAFSTQKSPAALTGCIETVANNTRATTISADNSAFLLVIENHN